MEFGQREELIKMFNEAKKKGVEEAASFFNALDIESKKVITSYLLDDFEVSLYEVMKGRKEQ